MENSVRRLLFEPEILGVFYYYLSLLRVHACATIRLSPLSGARFSLSFFHFAEPTRMPFHGKDLLTRHSERLETRINEHLDDLWLARLRVSPPPFFFYFFFFRYQCYYF
jgi:hypothetical protein